MTSSTMVLMNTLRGLPYGFEPVELNGVTGMVTVRSHTIQGRVPFTATFPTTFRVDNDAMNALEMLAIREQVEWNIHHVAHVLGKE